MPTFVVRPGSTKEVQKLVKYSNKKMLTLAPRSSTTPSTSVSAPSTKWILVDMSRMNSIINVDERNRAVRFEPGVRWGQLQDELAKHGLRAGMPLLPDRKKSALTSFVEREPPLIPKYEYAEPILTMEIVLANGDLFRTGSAAGPASLEKTKASLVGPHGPSVMDFFRLFHGARGSMGIVTWVNVKVETLPNPQKLFFIPCETLTAATAAMRGIGRKMIGYECFALDRRTLANVLSIPAGADGSLPPWTVTCCLGGGRRRPEKKLEYEQEALTEIAAEVGFEALAELGGMDSSFVEKLQRPWSGEASFKHALKGSSLDLFFITPITKTSNIDEAFSKLCDQHEVDASEVGRYVQPIEYSRTFHVEFSIPFAPDSEAERGKARALAKEAFGLVTNHGGFFSRPGGILEQAVRERGRSHTEATDKLRKIIDPNGVMNRSAL